MAETSNIAWTDATFNPVIGCTKIGPGCDNCYAEAQDSRKRWGGVTHWGPGIPRHRTSESYWKQPLSWNRKAEKNGKRMRVFCASLADVFDNEWPAMTRYDLWRLVEQTPWLDWLLLTKRIGNAIGMIPCSWEKKFPDNVRLMITVVNQEEADRDIPKLLALPCKNGISYEPALDPIDFTKIKLVDDGVTCEWNALTGESMVLDSDSPSAYDKNDERLQWVIVGGESSQGGNQARSFNIEWARSTVAQCKAAGVPVFVKQMGSNAYMPRAAAGVFVPDYEYYFKDRAGADPSEWPQDINVREFPL